MANYLITGGAGFIGSHLVEALLGQGESVRIFDNFSTGRMENIEEFLANPDFEIYEGDLRDPVEVDEAAEGMEYIFHQGALPSVPRSIEDPVTTNEVNVLGTLNVLEAARKHKVKRVVYASSSSVYGDSASIPKLEEMPVNPLSPYALTKYAGEKYCQLYHQIYGLETVSLRYFNVFGPRQDPGSQYSAVIPKFIERMKKGESPVIFGDGSTTRDFTFVENVVIANLLACTSKNAAGKVYNIACGKQHSLLELVDILNDIMKTGILPEFAPERQGDIRHSMAGIAKAEKDLGFVTKDSFHYGLQMTVKSFQK